MHFIFGGTGFLGLIAACLVFARRFAARGELGWATFSALTGVLYFAAFFGIAAGSMQGADIVAVVNIAFSLAVVLGWAWITVVAARLRNEVI